VVSHHTLQKEKARLRGKNLKTISREKKTKKKRKEIEKGGGGDTSTSPPNTIVKGFPKEKKSHPEPRKGGKKSKSKVARQKI